MKTAGISTQNFLQAGLGQQYHGKALKHLTMGNERLWILSKGDCYPTQYHKYRTGQALSDECTLPGCVRRETYDHAVCSCKIVSSTARAVHDRIWRGIFDVIKTSVPKGVRAIYDSTIKSIAGLRHNPSIANLQPDGVVIREVGGGFRGGVITAVELLEFTRTGDLWPDSLAAAHDKKTDKYALLLRELQVLHPAAAVRIVPFVLGSRSYLDEEHWAASWSVLKLKQQTLVKLLPKVQAWNVKAAR